MSDIIVAILRFPNDPTNNNAAHQLFIAEMKANGTHTVYSINETDFCSWNPRI